jgi:hypothetical protein
MGTSSNVRGEKLAFVSVLFLSLGLVLKKLIFSFQRIDYSAGTTWNLAWAWALRPISVEKNWHL